jgi:hypothetical protein
MLWLSFAMYAGLMLTLIGAFAVMRPIRRLRLSTRRRGAAAAVLGGTLVLLALSWPTPLSRAGTSVSVLDEKMPAWQFAEHHDIRVHATPDRVFEAIRRVTPAEIRYFSTLTRIRNPQFGASKESILAAPRHKPIMGVALGSGFVMLGEREGREIVIGTRVAPRVRAAMHFDVQPQDAGWSLVSTETRVFSEDARGLRAFTLYWRLIYPGSALIRIEWLRAIKRRAEH